MATFTNRATLTYSGGTANSNIVTGTVNETLAITKTALSDTYDSDSHLVYVLSLVNSGNTALTGITLTDDLGATAVGTDTVYPLRYLDDTAAYFINGVLQPTPTVQIGPPLVFDNISIPAGGNAAIVYEVELTEFANPAADGTITNTVTATGLLAEDVTASETVTAGAEPSLTITKSLSPLAVGENGELTYTFVIENFGNTAAEATDNIVVTDIFNPILTLDTVTLDGAALPVTTGYTYDIATGTFATVAGAITVPAATVTQNPDGSYTVEPGRAILTVTGTI